jgi:hypothetical protein
MEKTQKICVYAVVPYHRQWDYRVTAIMIEESLVFLDDDIHRHPDDFLAGVIASLEKYFPLEITKEVLLLDEDIYEYNETKVQEAIYKKWKSGN